MIVGLVSQEIFETIGYAIEDLIEEKGAKFKRYNNSEFRTKVINYIIGVYDDEVHNLVSKHSLMFLAFDNVYNQIMESKKKFENEEKRINV